MLESNIISYEKYSKISLKRQFDSGELDINIYADNDTVYICNENFGNVLVHYLYLNQFNGMDNLEQKLLVAHVLELQNIQPNRKNVKNLLNQLKNL